MPESSTAPTSRLLLGIEHATGLHLPNIAFDGVTFTDPGALAEHIAGHARGHEVVVTGTLDRRLVLIEHTEGEPAWTAIDLSGQPHATRAWPAWTTGRLTIEDPSGWLSPARISAEGVARLLSPRLLLVALYHPEYFPLPRFPLGISDVARAARATLLGQVELMDMQLGHTPDDVLKRITATEPDIVGISATFGQHDLMTTLLDQLTALDQPPLMVAGGSLTARNERLLLNAYPELLVARGAGEATIQDVLAQWNGDLSLDQVRGIGYQGGPRGDGTLQVGRVRRTATVANRLQTDIWPELDLLPATFAHRGVAQLESSRGCVSYCSFCPRGHKGTWAGTDPSQLEWVLAAYREVFDAFPDIAPVLYLVDEEFIGRDSDAVPRVLELATVLEKAKLAWETSCRIDQVVRPDHDRAWHLERAQMWRDLVDRGLRRCLFGVESGVTSILARFNKETTSEQNALAIRTLSALGVPTRFTYITFDQLMTLEELQESYAFQGRTDLILKPLHHLSVEEIVDGVADEAFVAEHSAKAPFHSAISYMLVSMECLIGAAYTRHATARGLTGDPDPLMGRVTAQFADPRIGVASRWAQLWVDRSFPFDYTLKSLEKILTGRQRHRVRQARIVLKQASYGLLGGMLNILPATARTRESLRELDERCEGLADEHLSALIAQMSPVVGQVRAVLPADRVAVLVHEHRRWAAPAAWQLINAATPCGS